MSDFSTTINARYKGAFTLLDAIKDPVISENLEKFYVPETEIKESIFIKKDANIAVTDDGPKRIRFIYLNPQGKNMTNPDFSYVQIPSSCKGFLVRLSISRNHYTPENLNLDYFIDISNIKYRVNSVMMRNNNTVAKQEILQFENIDFSEYSKIDFDRQLKEFILNKGLLFAKYF